MKHDPDFIAECRKKIQEWYSFFSDNIKNYHYFTEFVLNDQYKDRESTSRTNDKEVLQVNHLSAMAKTLVGEAFRRMPAFEIVPVRAIADVEKLKPKKLIAKEIMLNYRNRTALQNAAYNAAVGGFGAFEICHDYVSEMGFEQDIFFRQEKNPAMCFWDPNAKMDTKVDGEYSGYMFFISKKLFLDKYKNSTSGDYVFKDYDKLIDRAVSPTGIDMYWQHCESVMITKIFIKKQKSVKIVEIDSGEVITEKEYNDLVDLINNENELNSGDPEYDALPLPTVVNKRTTMRTCVIAYKIAMDHILEETEVPSKKLPLLFLDQQSYYNEAGKQVTLSYFQQAKDPQRYANYLITLSASLIKKYGYSAWMGTVENVRGREDQWRNVGSMQGMMVYNPDVSTGQLIKPERIPAPEIPVSLSSEFQKSVENITQTVGIYEGVRGMAGNEVSGEAIKWRSMRGMVAATPFSESINRTLATAGDIILEMIPKIYDTRRPFYLSNGDQMILNDDGGEMYAREKDNEVVDEEMHVKILPAPPLEEQKQETVQSIERIIAADPSIGINLLDLYIGNLDMNDKQEAINRVKALLPEEIIRAGETGERPPPPEPKEDPAELIARAANVEAEAKLQDAQTKAKAQEIKAETEILALQQEQERIEMERERAALEHQVKMSQLNINKYEADIKATSEYRKSQNEDEKTFIKKVEAANKLLD